MNSSAGSSKSRIPPLQPAVAARSFLDDIAQVSGFATGRTVRNPSSYVMRRPILTTPDPWFFAGLVALEAAKIADLFPPNESGALLREISTHADAAVGRRGRKIATLIFTLMGRLGYGAILMRMKVPDPEIGRIIRIFIGDGKDWKHLLPTVKAHRQVNKALATGLPSWWIDFTRTRMGDDSLGPRRSNPETDYFT